MLTSCLLAPRSLSPETHEHPRRVAVPVHVRVGHRRPPGQDVRPDLGRHPRQHPCQGSRRARGLRDRHHHRPGPRVRRDHDLRVRGVPDRRPRHGLRHRLHEGRVRLRLPDLRDDRQRQGAEPGHRPGRRPRAGARRRRPGDDVRVRLPRDPGAHAAADLARAPHGPPPGRGPQGRHAPVPAPGRQDTGHRRVRARRAEAGPHGGRVLAAGPGHRGPDPRRHHRVRDPADDPRGTSARSTRSCTSTRPAASSPEGRWATPA